MDKRLDDVFSSFDGKEEELIPILQKVQNTMGFLSDNSMEEIARFTRVPMSKIYGVATFYAQFRFTPKGEKHIMLCRGTACHVKGAPRIQEEIENQIGIKVGETSKDLKYSLEDVACIGACSLAPCAMVNNTVEANLTPPKVEKIFSKKGEKN
ncbi:NADH-quinone oxidoreductase subunit NuoE [Bacteroidota bacterium]